MFCQQQLDYVHAIAAAMEGMHRQTRDESAPSERPASLPDIGTHL
jgi:hypothetical protein